MFELACSKSYLEVCIRCLQKYRPPVWCPLPFWHTEAEDQRWTLGFTMKSDNQQTREAYTFITLSTDVTFLWDDLGRLCNKSLCWVLFSRTLTNEMKCGRSGGAGRSLECLFPQKIYEIRNKRTTRSHLYGDFGIIFIRWLGRSMHFLLHWCIIWSILCLFDGLMGFYFPIIFSLQTCNSFFVF